MPSPALLPSPARRLLVDGQRLLHEDRTPAFLRGFNLLFMLDSIFEEPREDTDELMLQLLPRTNLVRVVMIHWKDKPTDIEGADNKNDCSETWGQQWAIQESCLQQIEKVLRWTASQNLWAVLTVRASLAAGEPVAGRDLHTVFDDHELRSRFLQMWTTVAKRCRGLDMIAGYEIMSEPRVQNTAPEVVRDFYREGCAAAHSGDPRTPCIVGAAPFYNVHGLEGALMADVPNAIYAFNFFIPRKYVDGDAALKYKYPGPMRCCDAHEKEHARCCPGKADQDMAQLPCCAAQVQVDKRLLEQELAVAIDFRERHQVPVFMDQWAISRTSGRDRLLYVKDVLALLQAHRVHWAYWQWRQRDYSQMAVVTMNEDWDDPWFDEALVDVFRTVLGPDAYITYRDPPPPPRAHSPPPSHFHGLPPSLASPRLIDSTPIELPSPRPPSTAWPRPVDTATAKLAAPSPPSVEPLRLISSTSVALASSSPSMFPNSPPGYAPNSGPFEGQRLSLESDAREVVTTVTLRAAPSSSPSESESSVILSLPLDRHDRSSLVKLLELGPYSPLALLFMCLMCALAFGFSRKALARRTARRHCIATSRCVRPMKARTQYARIAAQAL